MTWQSLDVQASRRRRYKKSKRTKSLSALSTFRHEPAEVAPSSDLRSVGFTPAGRYDVAVGGARLADPAVLARARQSSGRERRRSARPRRRMRWWRGRSTAARLWRTRQKITEGVDGGREGHEGRRRQSIELVIGRSEPGRRVGARAWTTAAPKAPGQTPAGADWQSCDRPKGPEQPTSIG